LLSCPALKREKKAYYKTTEIRISRSPIATYRFGTGWELENDENPYPDEYLNGLAHCGINTVWVAGIFRNLIKSRIIPEATPNANASGLKKLRDLADRAASYGIKVYLFCMEPRALPAECEMFEKYPETKGKSWRAAGEWFTSLCTSSDLVKRFMKENVHNLFKAVPNLGGMIQIFAGERITNCRCNDNYGDTTISCEICSNKPRGEVLTDVINLYNRAMKNVAPEAKLIAWSYGMEQRDREVKEYVMDRMDKDIVWLENFEHNGKKKYFNRLIENMEYSLSYQGPSPEFKNILNRAASNGKNVYAKIQLGTTYEQSATPYISVPESVYGKSKFINSKNVPGVFVTWILGGYPDMMLKASDEALRLPMLKQNDYLKRLASIYWGEMRADKVIQAWEHFFNAFQNYPIDKFTFYYGPITRSPGYHLYLKPRNKLTPKWEYNWGITRGRDKQPFFDVLSDLWLGQFSANEVIELYRGIAKEWKKGVKLLTCAAKESGRTAHSIQVAIVETALVQFESAANVYEFYYLRDSWIKSKSTKLRKKLAGIVKHEIELAEKMKTLLKVDPRLGFHSELIYYVVSDKLLNEKIKQSTALYAELTKCLNP